MEPSLIENDFIIDVSDDLCKNPEKLKSYLQKYYWEPVEYRLIFNRDYTLQVNKVFDQLIQEFGIGPAFFEFDTHSYFR